MGMCLGCSGPRLCDLGISSIIRLHPAWQMQLHKGGRGRHVLWIVPRVTLYAINCVGHDCSRVELWPWILPSEAAGFGWQRGGLLTADYC